VARNDDGAFIVHSRSNPIAATLNDPQEEAQFLLAHAAHDYEHLITRWKAVAAETGLEMQTFATHGEYPVYGLRGAGDSSGHQGLYLSAGIHGDEAASTLGLITWAEANMDRIRERPCIIFPCLNPWGLVENRRSDEQGVDLNRLFHSEEHPFIQAWSAFVGDHDLHLALLLHEDYDAPGLYVYEVGEPDTPSIGEAALQACESIIPRHPSGKIEGREAQRGLILVTDNLGEVAQELMEKEAGLPEALCLRLRGTRFCLTFETPSEYSLFNRVRTQVHFIDSALKAAGMLGT